jgi:hypothetical protein
MEVVSILSKAFFNINTLTDELALNDADKKVDESCEDMKP